MTSFEYAFTIEPAHDVPKAFIADCPGCMDTCTWGYSVQEAQDLLVDAVEVMLDHHAPGVHRVITVHDLQTHPTGWVTGVLRVVVGVDAPTSLG